MMARGKVVNCFYDGSESGFGDFLRGSMHLHDVCKYYGLDFDIDISHHPINKYIYSDYDVPYSNNKIICLTKKLKKEYGEFHMYSNYKKVFHDEMISIKEDEVRYIFSNFNFLCNVKPEFLIDVVNRTGTISNETCEWFQKKLKFSDLIINEVDKELSSKNIKDFHVLHFRLGDTAAFYKKDQRENEYAPDYDEIFNICKEVFKKHGSKLPLVILSDSNDLKCYIKKNAENEGFPFYVFHLNSGHTQKKPSSKEGYSDLERTEDNLFYTVFDMRLISIAKSAESHSVYVWGSGFLTWMAKLFKVPVYLEKFQEKPKFKKIKSIDNCVKCYNHIFSKKS